MSRQQSVERSAEKAVDCGGKYGFDRADRTALGDIAYQARMERVDIARRMKPGAEAAALLTGVL